MAKVVKKVIKCFCNCSELTEEDVKNILLADVRGILLNKLGNTLFRKFAMLGNSPLNVPYVIDMLDCYEICDKVIEKPQIGSDYYERIQELCPGYTLECELAKLVEEDGTTEILSCLADIQFECVREIETDIVYRNFRLRLQDKIRNI